MTSQNVKKINKIVLGFLNDNTDSQNMSESWMETVIQKQIKNVCAVKYSELPKKKDPNAPKRGKSSYLFYCSEFRDQVKKELGNEKKATDVTKELGVRWNIMKTSKKASDKKALLKYESLAKIDRERYQTEKDSYVQPEEFENNTRRGGKKSFNNGPKRAKSVYLFFCEKYRDKVRNSNPSLKATEVTSKLGSMWNELKSDKSRTSEINALTVKANEDKIRYENEKKELFGSVEKPKKNEDPKNSSNISKTAEKEQSGFQLFCLEKRAELKKSNPKTKASDITKKLSAAWKELSTEDRKKWTLSVSVDEK